MKIYEKIENPIDNDENLKRIVDAYFDSKEDEDIPFYMQMVSRYAEDDTFNRGEFEKFKRLIGVASLKKSKEDIQNAKSKKYTGKKDTIEFVKSERKKRRAFRYTTNRFRRLMYKQFILRNARLLRNKTYIDKYTPEEFMEIYDKFSKSDGHSRIVCSEDEKNMYFIMTGLIKNNHVEPGLAGYHIYSKFMEDDKSDLNNRQYKLYLNIGYDHLYKFAKKYMEVCKLEGIPYSFKVLSPDTDKPDRAEKMCIYAPIEEIFKVIDIVRAIIDANPGLLISNPPVTAGKFDGVIGFGCDPNNREHSYNSLRAECIYEALEDYFGNIPIEEAKEIVHDNPQAIQQIRAKIKILADKYNIEQEKFCFSDGMEELFMEAEDNYVSKPLKFDKSELRIDGIKPSLFSTYTRLRAIYGKDSPEVREFFSRARKLKNRGKSSESNYRAKKEIEVHRNGVSHNDPDDACL